MGLARDRRGADRDALEVVEDACRGGPEMHEGEPARVGGIEERLDLRRRQIACEGVEGIALDGALRFAAQGRAGEHAERVEPRFSAIAVEIGDHFGLQHAIIELGEGFIADGVARIDERQVVFCIIGDAGDVAERITETMRQKEMRLREGEFLRRRVGGIGRVEDLAGGNPEFAFAVEIAILRFGSEENRRQFGVRSLSLEDVEQARGESQFVAFTGERLGFQLASGEKAERSFLR